MKKYWFLARCLLIKSNILDILSVCAIIIIQFKRPQKAGIFSLILLDFKTRLGKIFYNCWFFITIFLLPKISNICSI